MTDLTLRAALAEKIKRLAYEMSGQDVSAVLAPTGLSRQAHKYAMDTAKEFESAVDELAALAAAPESGDEREKFEAWKPSERAEFEAGMKARGWAGDYFASSDGVYNHLQTQSAWNGWQAGRASPTRICSRSGPAK